MSSYAVKSVGDAENFQMLFCWWKSSHSKLNDKNDFSDFDGGACLTSFGMVEFMVADHQELLALIDKSDNVMVQYQTSLASKELEFPSSLVTSVSNIINDLKLKQTKKLMNLLEYPLCVLPKLSKTNPVLLGYLVYTIAKRCERYWEQNNKKQKIFGKKYIKEVMKFIPIENLPVHKGMVANLNEFLKLLAFIRYDINSAIPRQSK